MAHRQATKEGEWHDKHRHPSSLSSLKACVYRELRAALGRKRRGPSMASCGVPWVTIWRITRVTATSAATQRVLHGGPDRGCAGSAPATNWANPVCRLREAYFPHSAEESLRLMRAAECNAPQCRMQCGFHTSNTSVFGRNGPLEPKRGGGLGPRYLATNVQVVNCLTQYPFFESKQPAL